MRMEVVITTVTISWAHIIAHVTLAMCYWMIKEIVQVCRQLCVFVVSQLGIVLC